MEEFTLRNAVKYVAKAVIHKKTADFVENVITDYTRFEEDDNIVDISSFLAGWYVSSKLKPVTDKMVDKTADFVVAKRAEFAAKKETEETQ